jgi:hypothetical protein
MPVRDSATDRGTEDDQSHRRLLGPGLWHRLSRMERVTGIEPAFSAWELLERVGSVWFAAGFAVPSGQECLLDAAGMAREWHGAGT